MEVVYEDFLTAVMVREGNHRPARLRDRDDLNLRYGKANFLPRKQPTWMRRRVPRRRESRPRARSSG